MLPITISTESNHDETELVRFHRKLMPDRKVYGFFPLYILIPFTSASFKILRNLSNEWATVSQSKLFTAYILFRLRLITWCLVFNFTFQRDKNEEMHRHLTRLYTNPKRVCYISHGANCFIYMKITHNKTDAFHKFTIFWPFLFRVKCKRIFL